MANYTLTDAINFAQPQIEYLPLTAGVNNEPAMTIATGIVDTILGPPFVWDFNRNNTTLSLVIGQQDYPQTLTDFGILEKASLTDATGKIWEIKDVYNSACLGASTTQQRPNACAVQANNFGSAQTFRFMGVPDFAYSCTLIYQKFPVRFTSLTGTWSGIPDSYSNIYMTLFLAECFQLVMEEQKAQMYRQRGVAMLLSVAQGLTEYQKNAFREQYLDRDKQDMRAQLRVQQGVQASGA